MSQPLRKHPFTLFFAVFAIAFATSAFEFLVVDADVEPPAVVSLAGEATPVCKRTGGGLLLAVDGGEDVVFAVSGGGDSPLGYRILSAAGDTLSEGEGVNVPLSEFPEAAGVFLYSLDGSPIVCAGSDGAMSADQEQRSPEASRLADGAGQTSILRQALGAFRTIAMRETDRTSAYPGLEGMFTVDVTIDEPTPEFSIFGISAPGGTTTMDTLPEFAESGPGHSNVCSVVATGGWFVPPVSGRYAFQVAGDDSVTLTVGGLVATSEWPHSPGKETNGFFSAGTRYPVIMVHSSVGGPASASVVKFAEPVLPTDTAGIVVSPHEVKFSLKSPETVESASASIVGALDPDCTYEIACVYCDSGISVVDNVASPDMASSAWGGTNRSATVTFALFRDGEEIDSDSAVFTMLPEKAETCECDCDEGTTADVGCVEFSQRFGRTPWIASLPVGRIAIRETSPVARLWTSAALVYDHPMLRRVAVRRESRPLDVVVLDPFGEGTEYRGGRPAGMSAGLARGIRYVNNCLVEVLEDRTEIKYNEDGAVESIRPPDGEPVLVSDLGIDVFRADSGAVTSVVSRADGRMDVETLSQTSYRVTWRGPGGAFVKSFTFSGDGQSVFRLHEHRSEQFQFDSEWVYSASAHDWTLAKAPGTPSSRTYAREISYDSTNGLWRVVRKTLDFAGQTVRTERSTLDLSGGHVMETSRAVGGQTLHFAVRNAAGMVATNVTDTGYATSYLYDEWNRVTNETSAVRGGIVRVVSTSYSADRALDGVVDRRPRRRTVAENGIVVGDEETIYEGNRITRIRRSGGEERVSFREMDGQGRTVLSVDEAGRATMSAYSAVGADFSWTETRDSGVWSEEGGFAAVDGKSTRSVTSRDASGNAVAAVEYALVGGEWRETGWVTNRYSATHKVVSSVRSDGKASAADWICTGPVWQTGEDGIAVTNAYDAAKALVRSTRYGPHGAVSTAYEYDADGRVVRETDSAPGCETRTRTRTYDERGRVISEADERGLVTSHAHSDDNLATTTTLPSGGTRTTAVNPDGSVASVTGTAVTPRYHSYGVAEDGLSWEKVTYLSPDGARWTKTYRNGFGDVVRDERPGANGATLTAEYTYNERGLLVSTVTTGQPAETRTYDAWGDLVSVTRTADGVTRTVETTTANALVDGEVWRVESRAASCSDAAIAPLVTTNMTQVSGLSLTNESRRISIDVRGNASETWSEFDPATSTRLTHSTIPTATNAALSEAADGVTTLSVSHSAVTNAVAYDAFRRAVIETDGRGNATTNAYDALGRLASTTGPTGATTRYAYDAAGRLAAVTNALGVATVYEYDLRGNKTYEGGGTYPVTYAYDAYNVMTNMTTYRAEGEQGGDTTSWTYDEATGLLLAKTYADGNGPTYTYTDSGNLATRAWARGVVTTYTYDGWNNLTNTAYSDGTRPMAFAYDALGRQVCAKDEGGITTTSYNAAGEVASEHTTGRLYTRTLARHRDACGRDIGYSLNNSRKTVVEYETDTGRTRRIQNAGVWFTYYYLQGTDLKSRLQYGGSGSAYYTYEPNRDLLTQVRNYINGGVISQYDYVNDAVGRRTEISRSGSMMSEARTDAYGYNDRNELILATKNAEDTEYQYSYDDIGNRIESLDLGTNRTYTANALNQYTSISNSALSASLREIFTPAFDLDGNQTLVRTSTGDWSVTYNAENRPVLWTRASDGTTIEMLFDRMGRRVEYIETANGITNYHHRFVYDGYLCIQRLDALSNNLIELSFAWDPTEPVATRPLVMQRNGGWNFFYTHDGNKNVSEVVSFQQARGVPAHYEYAPFGAVTAATRNTSITAFDVRSLNPYRFSSEYADDALRLVYYNYRHYNAQQGTWLSRDFGRWGRRDNQYLAMSNTPFTQFDFIGLSTIGSIFDKVKEILDGINALLINKIDQAGDYSVEILSAKVEARSVVDKFAHLDSIYICCDAHGNQRKLSEYDGVLDGSSKSWTIAHRIMGCRLAKIGVRNDIVELINYLHEYKEFVGITAKMELIKFIERNIGRDVTIADLNMIFTTLNLNEIVKSVSDYFDDTQADVMAVIEGYNFCEGDCYKKFIPPECNINHSKVKQISETKE